MDLSKTELDLWAKNVASSLDASCHHAIEGHTLDSITQEIANILHIEGFTRDQSKEIQEKLNDYRYVGEICDLFRGRHISWIRLFESNGERIPISNTTFTEGTNHQKVVLTEGTNHQKLVLTNGGIVTDIKFQENGIYIQCKNPRNQFMQFRFDHCLLFQKLTPEECILLLCKKNM
jgi:hypothetical protein